MSVNWWPSVTTSGFKVQEKVDFLQDKLATYCLLGWIYQEIKKEQETVSLQWQKSLELFEYW